MGLPHGCSKMVAGPGILMMASSLTYLSLGWEDPNHERLEQLILLENLSLYHSLCLCPP